MSAPFVTSVRVQPEPVRLGPPGAPTMPVRVQLADVWDAVLVEAPATEPVLAAKLATLERLGLGADAHEDYVMKLRGFEVLDEDASLADVGAVPGSIFLLARRRRRPVR